MNATMLSALKMNLNRARPWRQVGRAQTVLKSPKFKAQATASAPCSTGQITPMTLHLNLFVCERSVTRGLMSWRFYDDKEDKAQTALIPVPGT